MPSAFRQLARNRPRQRRFLASSLLPHPRLGAAPRVECEGAPPDPGWRQTDDPTTRSRHASPGGAQTPAQLATKREQSDTFSPSSARVALHRHPDGRGARAAAAPPVAILQGRGTAGHALAGDKPTPALTFSPARPRQPRTHRAKWRQSASRATLSRQRTHSTAPSRSAAAGTGSAPTCKPAPTVSTSLETPPTSIRRRQRHTPPPLRSPERDDSTAPDIAGENIPPDRRQTDAPRLPHA